MLFAPKFLKVSSHPTNPHWGYKRGSIKQPPALPWGRGRPRAVGLGAVLLGFFHWLICIQKPQTKQSVVLQNNSGTRL